MSKLLADFCINLLLFEKKELILHSKTARTGCTILAAKRRLKPSVNKKKQTNKGSEVIMPEYEHNREERIDAVIHEILSSKENAIRFMQEAGLYDAEGHLAPMYR